MQQPARTFEHRPPDASEPVELFSVELQEERCRFAEAIMLTAAIVALVLMTLSLIPFTVMILLWKNARLGALIGVGVLDLVPTIAAFKSLTAKLKGRAAFLGTLQELKKDPACLATPNSPGSNSADGN